SHLPAGYCPARRADLRDDEKEAEHGVVPLRRYRINPCATAEPISSRLVEIHRAATADRLSGRISAARQFTRPTRCRSDAYLFWAYRCSPTSIYSVLGQTMHRLFSWCRCDAESGEPGLRGQIAPGFRSGPTRPGPVSFA